MRYAIAIAVVAVAWSAALYVHQRQVTGQVTYCTRVDLQPGASCPPSEVARTIEQIHPSWEDPAAVLIALGGLAVAVGIVATGRKTS